MWLPGPGKALFDAIERVLGPLPIVAEDLGLITPDVFELRDGCGFPGMKILQFGFGTDATDEFLPHNWGRNFVAYTGTHDNHTVRGWWQTATERERNSVANIAVHQMQDVLGLSLDHRMNVPGTVGDHNWTWRFDWNMVDAEATRVLGLITAASGRTAFGFAQLR